MGGAVALLHGRQNKPFSLSLIIDIIDRSTAAVGKWQRQPKA
jgi:hypothetical protein